MIVIRYLIAGSICFLLDRITKMWALKACISKIAVIPGVSCTLAFNRGVAWSMFHADSPTVFAAVTAMVLTVMALVAWHGYQRMCEGHIVWAEVLVLAGALGNVWDRFVYGGVIDFIELSYHDFYWPLFNVADIMVVVGIGLLFIEAFRS